MDSCGVNKSLEALPSQYRIWAYSICTSVPLAKNISISICVHQRREAARAFNCIEGASHHVFSESRNEEVRPGDGDYWTSAACSHHGRFGLAHHTHTKSQRRVVHISNVLAILQLLFSIYQRPWHPLLLQRPRYRTSNQLVAGSLDESQLCCQWATLLGW